MSAPSPYIVLREPRGPWRVAVLERALGAVPVYVLLAAEFDSETLAVADAIERLDQGRAL